MINNNEKEKEGLDVGGNHGAGAFTKVVPRPAPGPHSNNNSPTITGSSSGSHGPVPKLVRSASSPLEELIEGRRVNDAIRPKLLRSASSPLDDIINNEGRRGIARLAVGRYNETTSSNSKSEGKSPSNNLRLFQSPSKPLNHATLAWQAQGPSDEDDDEVQYWLQSSSPSTTTTSDGRLVGGSPVAALPPVSNKGRRQSAPVVQALYAGKNGSSPGSANSSPRAARHMPPSDFPSLREKDDGNRSRSGAASPATCTPPANDPLTPTSSTPIHHTPSGTPELGPVALPPSKGGAMKALENDDASPLVKETKEVVKKEAGLPDLPGLPHTKPTMGSWLKSRDIVNNYLLLECLGTSSRSQARLAKDRTTNKLYTVKIINKTMVNEDGAPDYANDIKVEISIMKRLNHPHVVRLFEVMDDPKLSELYLVFEYMKMGDLLRVLKGDPDTKRCQPLSDQETCRVFRQVARGLEHLHQQHIVHGDINPHNLLVGADGTIKLTGFKLSTWLKKGPNQKLQDPVGSPMFMSPELCSAISYSGQLADVWALGCTMYLVRCGRPPFVADTPLEMYNKVLNDDVVFDTALDPRLQELLEGMLAKEPTERFTLQGVLHDSWLLSEPVVVAAKDHQQQAKGGAIPPSSSANNSEGGAGEMDVPSFKALGQFARRGSSRVPGIAL